MATVELITKNGEALKNHISVAPVGSIIAYPGDTPPPHTVLANGANLSRAQYAKLFAAYGTKYGAGDGSSTFGIPDCRGRVLQGDVTAGAYKAPGLPDITGNFILMTGTKSGDQFKLPVHTATGAFSPSRDSWVSNSNGGNSPPVNVTDEDVVNFSASDSNSIYGNSATVQPPALTVLYCIIYE